MPRRWSALRPMLATLLTMGLVDAPLRLLAERIIAEKSASLSLNPALGRIAGTVATRFIEVPAVLLGLAILFRFTRCGSFADLGLGRRGLRWMPVGCFAPIIALLLAALVAYAAGLLPVNRLLYPGPWPTLLALAAATHAAWIEEIGVRGVLMQGIERVSNRTAAILLSTAAFTALHLFAPFKLTWAWWIVVAVAGLGLAWGFYASGRSLWLTIGLHWGFNLGAFLLLGLPGETRGWLHWPESGPVPALSPQAGYVLLIGAALTALLLFLKLRKCQVHP